MKFSTILGIVFCLFLTGCATLTQPAASNGNKTLQGLFGVVTPEGSQSGHFTWTQNGSDFSLVLYGPLGLGAVTLSHTQNQYLLTSAEGQTYEAASAEAVLEEALGWSMPVSGFSTWLWGQPKINTLQAEGWTIDYTWGDSSKVPLKIIMLRPGVRVTIIMNQGA